MKQVYAAKGKAFRLLMALFLLNFQVAFAQHPSTWALSTDCNFVINFNINDGGFSSPSIYSGDDDFEMLYDFTQGWWEETSGRLGTGIGETSIISPVFVNPEAGTTVCGFWFQAPPGSEYRVRVVTSSLDPNLEIVASTANGPFWNPLPGTSGAICLRINDLDILAGQILRYEVSFRAFAPGDIIFDDFQLQIQQSPLPVTFMGFVARKEANNNIKLLWNVAKEVNVSHYDVERSTNGISFTKIGEVTASGKAIYNFVDANVSKGTFYYRVRNVDFDNQFKYTGILRVNMGSPTNNTLQLYPNPSKDYVYIQHEKAPNKASIRLMNMEGKLLQRIETVPNTVQTSIITSKLKSGMYIIVYDDGEGVRETLKFVKD